MEEIANRDPIDRQASIVTSKGEHYHPDKKFNGLHFEICPPIRDLSKIKTNIQDLTGKRFGRFTVVGLSDNLNGRWVVRCQCGHFEMRRSKAINNPNNNIDRCDLCAHLRYQRRHSEYLQYGRNLDEKIEYGHASDRFRQRFSIRLNSDLRKSILYRIQGNGRACHFIEKSRFDREKWRVKIRKRWVTVVVSSDYSEIVTVW